MENGSDLWKFGGMFINYTINVQSQTEGKGYLSLMWS